MAYLACVIQLGVSFPCVSWFPVCTRLYSPLSLTYLDFTWGCTIALPPHRPWFVFMNSLAAGEWVKWSLGKLRYSTALPNQIEHKDSVGPIPQALRRKMDRMYCAEAHAIGIRWRPLGDPRR